jgi:hypothetical protein
MLTALGIAAAVCDSGSSLNMVWLRLPATWAASVIISTVVGESTDTATEGSDTAAGWTTGELQDEQHPKQLRHVENVAVPAKQHNLAATIAVEIASPAAVQWRPSPGWKYMRVHSMLTVYVCVSLFANPGHVFFTLRFRFFARWELQ